MTALALTDKQLALVLKTAEQIPHRWRGRYLEGIADYLFGRQPVADDDVREAVCYVAVRFHRNIVVASESAGELCTEHYR